MKQQLVRVGDVLDIEQLNLGVDSRIKGVIHILEYVFNTYLLTIANRPDTIELQSFDDGTLENKDGSGARAADEIDTLRIQFGDRLGEDTVVLTVE